MSIKNNHTKPVKGAPNPGMTHELEVLRALLRDLAVQNTTQPVDEVMAVVRFFSGISPGDWHAVARGYGLEQWLPVELSGEAANIWEHWGHFLDEISFQRDHDPLTGLYNRRYFERELSAQLSRAERRGTDLSLAVLDLDRFKNVNDTYGHAVGDDVLAYLGKLLLEDGRHYDIAARLGGEEFAILLPDTPILQAKSIVERFLVEFRRKVFRGNSKGAFTVTFSAGIASRWGKMEISPAELLEDADRTMYAAKAAGRNTIELGAMSDGELKVMRSMVRSDEKKFLFGLG